jgi:hypothetical protein
MCAFHEIYTFRMWFFRNSVAVRDVYPENEFGIFYIPDPTKTKKGRVKIN